MQSSEKHPGSTASQSWQLELPEQVVLNWWHSILKHAAETGLGFTYGSDTATRSFLDSKGIAKGHAKILKKSGLPPHYLILIHPEFLFLSWSDGAITSAKKPAVTSWTFSPSKIRQWLHDLEIKEIGDLPEPKPGSSKHPLACSFLLTREIQTALVETQFLNTQLQELEEKVLHLQKMENLGLLARNIGHDLNNLMSPITGYAQFLRSDLPENSPLRRYAEHIHEAAEKSENLIKQLLKYAPIHNIQFTNTDLRGLIEESGAILAKKSSDRQIQIKLNLPKEPCNADVIPNKILEVLVLSMLNAQEASDDGGTVSVTLKEVMANDEFKAKHPKAVRSLYYRISIQDHGKGMTPETLARAFEPFFSTKPQGPGIGLGLPVIEGIVAFHKGFTEIKSAPKKGTEFTLFLPATPSTAKQAIPTKHSFSLVQHSPDKTLRVLLIEDETPTQEIIAALLDRNNCRVTVASTGEQAIEILKRGPQDFDLILLDIIMPGMGGYETFLKMQELSLKIPVIISTGYAKDWHVAEILRMGAIGILRKPYGLAKLAEALELVRPKKA